MSQRIGHNFSDPSLLAAAITHRSKAAAHNERLEFLGDSLLNFTMAAELFHRFPKAKEGELTRLRARLVRGETLAQVARDLDLGEFLLLGAGELKSGGHQRDSILADALEAVIGALFLDGGMGIAQHCIKHWFEQRLNEMVPESASEKDAKTKLQEYLQRKKMPLPEYHVESVEGDPHDPLFHVSCNVALLDTPILGIANSRRKAEQAAAEETLKVLMNGG